MTFMKKTEKPFRKDYAEMRLEIGNEMQNKSTYKNLDLKI